MYVQLDLFEDSQITLLRFEIEQMKKAQENLRRGLFGRYDKLQKKVNDLTLECDRLRAKIQWMEGSQGSSGLDGVLNESVISF